MKREKKRGCTARRYDVSWASTWVTRAVAMGFLADLPLLAVVWLVHQRAGGEPRRWRWPLLMLALVALPYAGGALSLADVLLDHAAPPFLFGRGDGYIYFLRQKSAGQPFACALGNPDQR